MKVKSRYSLNFIAAVASGLVLFCILLVPDLEAQQKSIDDPDGMYLMARELAFEGNYEQARKICDEILEAYPQYHDVKVLKARTFSWEGDYVTSKQLLQEVLAADANHKDALYALIDVLIWSENYEEALQSIDKALNDDPNNVQLLYRKALSLKETGDELAAVVILNQILTLDPTNAEAKELLDSIETNRLLNFVSVGYRGFHFLESNNNNKPWHLYYAELGRRTRMLGPVILRTNYADRSDIEINSLQIEVEAYPTVRPGTYLYLNAGYSPDKKLFPITRFGFELYQALPASWEFSGGFRLLNFDATESQIITKDLLIITGSLSKYYKKYYFSLRPYFTFSSVGSDPNSSSIFFTARRYFNNNDNYLSLTVGRGFSADYDRLSGGQVYDLSGTAVEAMLLYQQRITHRWLFRAGAGYKLYKDEVLFGNPVIIEGSLIYRF